MPRTAEPITVALGRAIRERRDDLGLSQEQLAARCELHRTYLADVERGNRNPSLESIESIAKGLGVPVSELFKHVERIRERGATGNGR